MQQYSDRDGHPFPVFAVTNETVKTPQGKFCSPVRITQRPFETQKFFNVLPQRATKTLFHSGTRQGKRTQFLRRAPGIDGCDDGFLCPRMSLITLLGVPRSTCRHAWLYEKHAPPESLLLCPLFLHVLGQRGGWPRK